MVSRALLIVGILVTHAANVRAQQRAPSITPTVAESPSTEVPIQRFRESRDGSFAQFSGLGAPARLVIRDAETWKAQWEAIHRPFVPAPPLPSVDFSREIVILAAAGSKSSGGYDIRIADATASPTRLSVTVRQVSTGEGCVVAAVMSQPVDIVRIPATPLPIEFVDVMRRVDCAPGTALRR